MAKVADAYIEIGAETDKAERDFTRFIMSLNSQGMIGGKTFGQAFNRSARDNFAALFDDMGRSMLAPILGATGTLKRAMAEAANSGRNLSTIQKFAIGARGALVATALSATSLAGTLTALSQAGSSVSHLTTALATLGTTAASTAGDLLGIIGTAAQASKIVLMAPAMLAAVGAGYGIISAAMIDAGDVIGDLQPKYEALQKVISSAFWSTAEEGVRRFTSTFVPLAKTHLPAAAAALGDWANAVAGAFSAPGGVEAFKNILAGIEGMFSNMYEGVATFTGAILTLAEAGAAHLPAFGTWFSDIGTQFEAWTDRITSDGSFDLWVGQAVSALQSLGSIIMSTIGVFSSLSTAAIAAGGATVQSFAEGFAALDAALKTEEWQARLTAFFATANAGADLVWGAFGRLLTQVGSMGAIWGQGVMAASSAMALLMDGVTTALQSFPVQNNITRFFETLPMVAQAAGWAVVPALEIITGGLAMLGSLAAAVGPSLAVMLRPLADGLTQIAPAVDAFIQSFGTGLLGAAQVLAPVLGQVVTDGVLPLLDAFTNLWPILTPLAQLIASILSPALAMFADKAGMTGELIAALVTAFTSVTGALTPIIDMVMGMLVPLFVQLSDAVLPVLKQGVEQIGAAFTELLVALQPAIAALVSVLGPALSALIPIIVAVVQMIVGNLVGAIQGIAKVVSGVVNLVKAIIAGDWSAIWSSLGQIVMGALQAVWNIIQLMWIGKALKAFSTALKAIPGLFSGGFTAVRGVVTGAFTAINSAVSNGFSFIRGLFTSAGGALRGIMSSVWGGIRSIVSSGMNLVRSIISGGMNLVRAVWTSVWGLIRGVVTGAWGVIRSIVTGGINVVKSVVLSGMTAVRGTISLAMNAARAAVTGALTIIRSAFTAAWGFVKSATHSFFSALNAFIGSIMRAILAVVKTVLNGIRLTFTTIWNAVKAVVTGAINAVKSVISGGMSGVLTNVTNVLNKVRSGFKSGMEAARNAVKSGVDRILGFFRDLPGKVVRALSGFKDRLKGVGGNIMDGLKNGILGGAASVVNSVADTAKRALDKAKSLLGIKSPSRVFRDVVGKMIPAGWGGGVLANSKAAIDPVVEVARRTVDSAQRALDGSSLSMPLAQMGMSGAGVRPLEPADVRPSGPSARQRGESAGDTYNLAPGAIVLDVSNVRELTELADFMGMIRVQARRKGQVTPA